MKSACIERGAPLDNEMLLPSCTGKCSEYVSLGTAIEGVRGHSNEPSSFGSIE